MNDAVRKLMRHHRFIKEVQDGLPFAFQKAEVFHTKPMAKPNGMEVGKSREAYLTALVRQYVGDALVDFSGRRTSQVDMLIDDKPLEIKTVSDGFRKRGKVTGKWTSDTKRAEEGINAFRFKSDILLARIYWGVDTESLFYIPVEVLSSLAAGYASRWDFLEKKSGSDTLELKIKDAFMLAAQSHADTEIISVHWQRADHPFLTQLDECQDFWRNKEYTRAQYPTPPPAVAVAKKRRHKPDGAGNRRAADTQQRSLW